MNNRKPALSSANSSNIASSNSMGIDALDIKIIRELMSNPNSNSSIMAKKFATPISTIQRRRSKLEDALLMKKYELSIKDLGWRNAEILMLVENGKANYMAKELLEKYDNVIETSIRINTRCNLAAYIGFRTSNELHELIEKIRGIPDISNLEWSEVVGEVGRRNHRLARLILDAAQ